MELVNNEKALYTVFLCIGYGLICGACRTLVSLCICPKTHTRWHEAARDILFFLLGGVGLFLLSLPLTDGRPRFWLFAGTAAGVFCWLRLFENPFCRLVHTVLRPFVWLHNTIGHVLSPVRVGIRKNLKKTEFFLQNLLKFKWYLLYNRRK